MKTFEESFNTPSTESEMPELIPDLAERLQTIERANIALERARMLLERANGLGPATSDFPARSNDQVV